MAAQLVAGRSLLDKIIAILPHKDGDILILSSDLSLSLDGSDRNLHDVVVEGLLVLKARDLGVIPTKAMIETMINSIQKKHNLTLEELSELFERQGLSLEEGQEQLKRRRMIEEVISILVRVEEPTKEEIEEYYKAHITYSPITYTVQLASVPKDSLTKKELATMLRTGKPHKNITWDQQEPVSEPMLSDEQKFVTAMKVGEIVLMRETDEGYELVRLFAKTPSKALPLDEVEISMALREQRGQEMMEKLQRELLNESTIRWLDPEMSTQKLLDNMDVEKLHNQIKDRRK